jgi:hypothetical protein
MPPETALSRAATPARYSCASRNPVFQDFPTALWIPAGTGMTGEKRSFIIRAAMLVMLKTGARRFAADFGEERAGRHRFGLTDLSPE